MNFRQRFETSMGTEGFPGNEKVGLNPREIEVLELVAPGKMKTEIGVFLHNRPISILGSLA